MEVQSWRNKSAEVQSWRNKSAGQCQPRNSSAKTKFCKSPRRTFPVADSRGLSSLFSAAEVPPIAIRGGSDRIRGGTNLFRASPPSPRRIPRRTFLFREQNEFGGLRRGLGRTYADPGGVRRGMFDVVRRGVVVPSFASLT